jgi:hypothetical protein
MIATAYDHDGNRRVQIELRIGDRVQWKRQGQTGTLDAVVKEFSISGERVRIMLIESEERRWVKPRFSSIHRNGQRLP